MKIRDLALFLLLGFVLATVGPRRSLAQPTDQPAAAQTAPDLMPLDPQIVRSYREAGREVPSSSAEARFADRPNVRINRIERPTVFTTNASNATNVKAIVLLVQFTDNPPGGPTARYRATVWDSMLFRDNYIRGGADTTTTHTLKSFYNSISYGAVDVVTLDLPSVTGWLTAPNNYAYYCQHDGVHDNGFGPYPRNVQRLVMDAVIAADPYVDFSQYAVGGVVQNLFVVHAGSGAEWSGGGDLIWSHAWSIAGSGAPPLYADGVLIANYSMEPEAGGNTLGEGGGVTGPLLPTVGVYAHEFGHVLGLPDEYDYGYQSAGTGDISLMAGGSWNQTPNVWPDCAGNSPARPSAWGMAYLGFVTPTVVTTLTIGITIPPIETTGPGSIYKLIQPGSGGKEYWLFENRQQLGFDAGFASMGAYAHGLCIYHVDENVMSRTFWRPNEAECVNGGVYRGQRNCDCAALSANPSNGEKWYGISVEQADGLYHLERNYGNGWADFYPNTTPKTSFTPSTVPNTSSYYTTNNCAGTVAATNIQEVGGNIILDLTDDTGAPDIVVTPDALTVELTIGQQATRTLTIFNTGDSDLDFALGAVVRALWVPVYPELKLGKGELDPRPGILGKGGPDLFGYTWRDSDEPGGPAFSWVDITGIGSPLALSGDDATVTGVPIGFSFPFYGNTFNTVNVSTNGFLSFTSSSAQYSNSPLPSLYAPENLLAVLWNDLTVTQGSVYAYYDASRFIVSYTGVPRLGGGPPQTFQVILYPSGRIVYQYLTCPGTWDADATVGIQNATGSDGLTVECNMAYLHDNLAVELRAMPGFLTVTPAAGTILAGDSLDLTVTFDATDLPAGDYHADLAINSNDPNESTVLVPANLHVIGDPDLAVTPDSLTADLFTGQQITRTLTITSLGASDLPYEISVRATGALASSARISQRFTPAVTGAGLQVAAVDRLASVPPFAAAAKPLRAPLSSAPALRDLSLAADAGLRILMINVSGDVSEIRGQVAVMPGVAVVDEFVGDYGVPTLDLLHEYGSAILIASGSLPDAVGLGNVLADYADQGGGVVLTPASFSSAGEVQGRLLTGGYVPFTTSSGWSYGGPLGVFDPVHPIMNGVAAVTSGLAAMPALTPGAQLVAAYEDGLPLVATQGRHVVGVNLYFGASGYWTGDVPELMYNAAAWASGPQWVWTTPRQGIVPAGGSVEVTATLDATGLFGGDYRADMVVESSDPDGSRVRVPACLHVTDPPLAIDELKPVVSFALHGLRTNPTMRDIIVAFSLPDAGSAMLELIDISGRRVVAEEVGSLGPGRHAVTLGVGTSRAPGVYLVRLSRAGQSFTARAVVIR